MFDCWYPKLEEFYDPNLELPEEEVKKDNVPV